MTEKECIIGFDARRMRLRPKEAWDADRRRIYLLAQQAEFVLSTDCMVWPSLFAAAVPPELKRYIPEPDPSDPIAPAWLGPNSPFWSDLSALREHVLLARTSEPHWLIAATCIVPPELEIHPPYFEEIVPAEVDAAWDFLGYDVSDLSGLSGLSNCGYDDDDFAGQPREHWAAMLNQHHLFTRLDDAHAFRRFSDARVKEHAPFLVYGLYKIETQPA